MTYDGSIVIRKDCDNIPEVGGDLASGATIKVVGCHSPTTPLEICIGGDTTGTVSIVQTECAGDDVIYSCNNVICPEEE